MKLARTRWALTPTLMILCLVGVVHGQALVSVSSTPATCASEGPVGGIVLTAAQTGLPSFGPSDFTIDFGQPILNFQDDDGSGVCIEVVASGGFGGGSGSDGGFPSNPDCQVDGDVVVDNAGGNITLSFIDSGSLVPGNSIGISGVVLSEENSETVHAVVLSTAMPILAGQNVALVVSCGPVGNSGLQQQVDDLEQDFADHTHPYLTGKGQGHNNVEATTGPADVPSPE